MTLMLRDVPSGDLVPFIGPHSLFASERPLSQTAGVLLAPATRGGTDTWRLSGRSMSATKRRVVLKRGQVRSIRLRNGHYGLMQVLENSQVSVFNSFRTQDEWGGLRLSPDAVLFTCTLLKSVWARSATVCHPEVEPVPGLTFDETRIDLGGGFREVTLWPGTADERTFLVMGNGENRIRRIERAEGGLRETLESVSLNDYGRVLALELTNLCDYPAFNERLYLCELFGRNIDPLKEIAFGRPLDPMCRTFVDIIAGKTPLSLLGY